jgi:hypothetical protein
MYKYFIEELLNLIIRASLLSFITEIFVVELKYVPLMINKIFIDISLMITL